MATYSLSYNNIIKDDSPIVWRVFAYSDDISERLNYFSRNEFVIKVLISTADGSTSEQNKNVYIYSLVDSSLLSIGVKDYSTGNTYDFNRPDFTGSFKGLNTGTTIYYRMNYSNEYWGWEDSYCHSNPLYTVINEWPYYDDFNLLIDDGNWIYTSNKPIIYVPANCQLSGPTEASSGDDVSVLVTPDSGYSIKNPTQGANISVYNKDGYVPFTFSNNQINFTMP